MSSSSAYGSGIMLLNSQVKTERPDLNIKERSELVTEMWHNLTRKEKNEMNESGASKWICDPARREICVKGTFKNASPPSPSSQFLMRLRGDSLTRNIAAIRRRL
jgi:hypothetical protein